MIDSSDAAKLDPRVITLSDYAEDIHAIICEEAPTRHCILVGHAYGNRLARYYASQYPAKVSALILMAVGGQRPIPFLAKVGMASCTFTSLPDWWRRNEIARVFFAQDHAVPDYWLYGWNRQVGMLQMAAVHNTTAQWQWVFPGPVLVFQGVDDKIAPVQDAGLLAQQHLPLGTRVHLLYAGHAQLPEQHDEIVRVVCHFLRVSNGRWSTRPS